MKTNAQPAPTGIHISGLNPMGELGPFVSTDLCSWMPTSQFICETPLHPLKPPANKHATWLHLFPHLGRKVVRNNSRIPSTLLLHINPNTTSSRFPLLIRSMRRFSPVFNRSRSVYYLRAFAVKVVMKYYNEKILVVSILPQRRVQGPKLSNWWMERNSFAL